MFIQYVLCVFLYLSVCGSLYGLLTGLPESEMPYHFYTDQRFALVLLCVFLILPLSIPKEISIQKYIRSGDDAWERACRAEAYIPMSFCFLQSMNCIDIFVVIKDITSFRNLHFKGFSLYLKCGDFVKMSFF